MSKSTLNIVSEPVVESDPLHELIRSGARKLINEAVQAELDQLLKQFSDLTDEHGRQAIVRNGYLPERTVQTGVGDVAVKVPKVRDRSGSGVKFNSALLPPYLKRAKSVDELIPWLYLRGISTGDFQEALGALVGEQAKGLSANTISRLKERWVDEHKTWQRRELNSKRYVYLWADGVYSNVRQDDRLCLLVIVGVTEHRRKELVAIEDGYRESEASWLEVLRGLQQRGLSTVPKLAIGDGALGFWKALHKVFPQTRQQRCWVRLRTTNPIESTFATVRLRTKKTRNCGSRDTTLAMVFKLLQSAQNRWKRIKGFNMLELVINNVEFQDGEVVKDQSVRNAA